MSCVVCRVSYVDVALVSSEKFSCYTQQQLQVHLGGRVVDPSDSRSLCAWLSPLLARFLTYSGFAPTPYMGHLAQPLPGQLPQRMALLPLICSCWLLAGFT